MTFLDMDLSEDQRVAMEESDPADWFTKFEFRNGESPANPRWDNSLRHNHERKQALVGDWIDQYAPEQSVLDAFCANGAFSFRAAQAGATEVVGVDLEPGRIEVAKLVASWFGHEALHFEPADVYKLASRFQEPFDVTLALGGLYHVPDPPYVLDQLRSVTRRYLILQTSAILPGPTNRARFVVRSERRHEGLASIRGGRGAWKFSAACVRRMLEHAGFEVIAERRPELRSRRRFPWWCAVARAV